MQPGSLILIFEPCADGHRFAFVRLLAQYHLEAGHRVMVATRPQAVASREYEVHIAPLLAQPGASVVTLPGPATTYRGMAPWGYIAQIRRLVRERAVAQVLVPDADRVFLHWTLAARLLRTPVAMLLVRPPRARAYTSGPRSYIIGWVKSAVIATCTASPSVVLARLTLPTGYEPARPLLMAWMLRRTVPVKDPVPAVRLSARSGRIRGRNPVVTLAGVITERKGLAPVLDFAARSNVTLVLAGKLANDVTHEHLRTISRLVDAGRCRAPDRYLSDAELNDSMAESDALILAYDRQTLSSGILGRAIRLKCPVLVVGGESAIAAYVRESGIGVVVAGWTDVGPGLLRLEVARPKVDGALVRAVADLDDGTDFAASLRSR